MNNLVQELINNPLDVNPNFRLFLSSVPSKTFPNFVLQNSLKVTIEPPKSLKAKMKKSFANINRDFFEDNGNTNISQNKITIIFLLVYSPINYIIN